jgi:CheY-like chemotaxis protein
MPPSVLLVEDKEDTVEVLTLLLEMNGFCVRCASDGRDGTHMLERQIPDLILSDFMMPHVDGITFCNKVKSTPAWQHIPFILMSAAADRLDLTRAPADAVLRKPFRFDDLLSEISTLLAKYQAAQSPPRVAQPSGADEHK